LGNGRSALSNYRPSTAREKSPAASEARHAPASWPVHTSPHGMIVGRMRSFFCIALLLAAALLCSQPAPREQVGPLPGGGFLLNSGWRLEPAGKQIPLDTFPMSTALSPDGHYLLVLNGGYKPPTISVLEAATGRETNRVPVADGWLGLTFSPKGDRVYVGGGSPPAVFAFFFPSWTDGAVSHYDTASGNQLTTVRLGPHPTDMIWAAGKSEASEGETPWAARLFIAASNTNSVYTLGVSEGNELRLVETINTAMTPRQPAGMTPSALAIGQQGKHLYVVCSDANVVAVVDISEERSHVEGFIPTGWYPTAARVLPNGTLVVLNGRGLGSHPNPHGPNPTRRPEASHKGETAAVEYVGRIQTGTASFIDPFTGEQLQAYTKAAMANSPYRQEKLETPNPFPPIEPVIYIVKENRSYDQVLGDMKEGNGDPSLVLFGENVTPNEHKIARQFVLLDNFYVNGDVSADGHSWSTAAIATD